MNTSKVINHIVNWLKSYSIKSKTKGFVVGISGGIDSAVTSTLACMTGLPTLCIQMPIYQSKNELLRSGKHIKWLNMFKNFEEEFFANNQKLAHLENSRISLVKSFLHKKISFPSLSLRQFFCHAYHYYSNNLPK